MNNIVLALQIIAPSAKYTVFGENYSDIQWLDTSISQPTEDQINAIIPELPNIQAKNACKQKAKALLSATDWSVLPDVGLKNQADFVYYRGILRGLVLQPQVNPDFPIEPVAQWQ